MKRFILATAHVLGIAHFARFLHTNTLTILLYHGVAPRENRGIYNYRSKFIEPRLFEYQMRYFKKYYTVLNLDEAVEKLRTGTLPPYSLAITFDDGYRNFYTHAYPIVTKLHLPATMFVATDFVCKKIPLWVDRLEYAMGKQIGTYKEKILRDAHIRNQLKKVPEHEREERLRAIESEAGVVFEDFAEERSVYAPLSDSEIREMHEHGISFGAHTQTHPILSRENSERVREEIADSKSALERICGSISRVFAYPNGVPGDWNSETESILEQHGFSAALTTIEGTNTQKTHPMRLRRMVMDGTEKSTFASIASGVRLWLRTVRTYV